MGFDRLRESGFNEEEIRDIRAQFHRTHGSSYDGGKHSIAFFVDCFK